MAAETKSIEKLDEAQDNDSFAEMVATLEAIYHDDNVVDDTYYRYDYHDQYLALRHSRGDMPGNTHNDLVENLLLILRWYYRDFSYYIEREMNFFQTDDPDEVPLYPDLFLRKGEQRNKIRSYRIKPGNPSPELIIEVASDDTVDKDLGDKVRIYAKWGVAEYFVFDPRPRVRKLKKPRLYGWRLVNGKYNKLTPGTDGRMWSEQIQSWLVPDGEDLRLYDANGNLRLTEGQAEKRRADAAQVEIERLKAEIRRLKSETDNKN